MGLAAKRGEVRGSRGTFPQLHADRVYVELHVCGSEYAACPQKQFFQGETDTDTR